jgi:hypothetical protein
VNIIEAVRSGKKFRHSIGREWLHVNIAGIICFENGNKYVLIQDEIMWPNWEIGEKKIEITESQLVQALNACRFEIGNCTVFKDRLCRELGFK